MTQREWLIREMADTAEELAGLIDFVEKNLPGATKRDARAFTCLLDGIVVLARAQGELLPALKEYGIYTVKQALEEEVKEE